MHGLYARYGDRTLNFTTANIFKGGAIFQQSFELIYAKYATEWGQVD
jgi:hypothetical protein